MTKFKKFIGQMAIILASTTAYPTISEELSSEVTITPVIDAIDLSSLTVNVQEQVTSILTSETQQAIAKQLLAMNEKEQQEEVSSEKSE
ncbi:hypothetical protein [Aestuariibacter sp. A3R04]|uniref:hypothetical protein n=1 Tax=Aestuariibacter sp. A3R04 TaxID=2841571 RepID=UPI001C0885CD|nr:hypothetical protein [Aestuariibacter sp. A3R04]MBU3022584.1 hypothetical protein [Aestuariibacter sp. A3R04]